MTDCEKCSDRGWNLSDSRVQPCSCGIYDPPKWVRDGHRPCLLSHFNDPNRPRRAAVGWLCNGHFLRLEQMIAELPSLHDALGLALTSTEKPNSEGGKAKHSQVTGGVSLNQQVVKARDELKAECVRMVRETAEGRCEALPLNDTVNGLAGWLLARLDWICDQLDVDDLFGYVQALTSECRSVAYPSTRQRIDLTKRTGLACSTVTTCDVGTHDGVACGGNLKAHLTGGGWEGDEGRLSCDRCGLERPITLVALADFGGAA